MDGREGLVLGHSQTWKKFSSMLYSHLGEEDFQHIEQGVTPLPAMNSFSAHTRGVAAAC